MEISITLDQSDWAWFQAHVGKELPKRRKRSVFSKRSFFMFWLVLTFLLLISFDGLSHLHWPSVAVTTLLFLLFFALIFAELADLQKSYAPSEQGIFVGTHHFTFDESRIHSKGRGYEGHHAWSLVKRLERTEEMILLYLDTAYAFIFPVSKLENPDEFYAYVNELFNQHAQDAS